MNDNAMQKFDSLKVKFHLEMYCDWNPSTREHERCHGCYQTEENQDWYWYITVGEVKKELGRAFYNAIIRYIENFVDFNNEGYEKFVAKCKSGRLLATEIKVRWGDLYKMEEFRFLVD